ncbi:unnamed protein product [Somion occarium]|uniref:Transmembrane protein n=1 Tax=Somion occarium TaxID=3059160 RepID=A0ABP1D1I7_9APHY
MGRCTLINRNLWLEVAAALWASSLLPTAQAYCYIDSFGFERCTMGTGARIGIAFGLIALAALVGIMVMVGIRRRRAQAQKANLAYVHNPVQNNQAHYYPGYPQGYPPPGGYDPNGPQYPPQAYTPYPGYDPATGYAPPMGSPPQYYAPPAGPPPDKA